MLTLVPQAANSALRQQPSPRPASKPVPRWINSKTRDARRGTRRWRPRGRSVTARRGRRGVSCGVRSSARTSRQSACVRRWLYIHVMLWDGTSYIIIQKRQWCTCYDGQSFARRCSRDLSTCSLPLPHTAATDSGHCAVPYFSFSFTAHPSDCPQPPAPPRGQRGSRSHSTGRSCDMHTGPRQSRPLPPLAPCRPAPP